jgi:hypothetical protein
LPTARRRASPAVPIAPEPHDSSATPPTPTAGKRMLDRTRSDA